MATRRSDPAAGISVPSATRNAVSRSAVPFDTGDKPEGGVADTSGERPPEHRVEPVRFHFPHLQVGEHPADAVGGEPVDGQGGEPVCVLRGGHGSGFAVAAETFRERDVPVGEICEEHAAGGPPAGWRLATQGVSEASHQGGRGFVVKVLHGAP